VMKMRHRAKPADPKDRVSSVPIDHRMHVRVLKGNEEKTLWLRKVSVDFLGECVYVNAWIFL